MPNFAFFKKGGKIGMRLIGLTIAFSSLITLFITAAQLFVDYREQRSNLETVLDMVNINLPNIVESVWVYDENQIQLGLNALVKLRDIEHVTIITSNKKRQWNSGSKVSKDIVSRSYELKKLKRDKKVNIGTLEVTASLDAIYDRLISKAISILLSNGIKTFLVALFMFLIFFKLVTSRINNLAENVDDLSTKLALSPILKGENHGLESRKRDEIDMVDMAIKEMATKLEFTIDELRSSNIKLQDAYDEVRTINEELEQRVAERTDHLRQEIAERTYVQDALQSSEERFRDIAESASDWFWEMDTENKFTFLSRRSFEVTGHNPENYIGKTRQEVDLGVITENDPHNELDKYEEAIKNREPFSNICYPVRAADGKTLFIELSGRPFNDKNGKFNGFRGAARDITKQIDSEKQLRKAKELSDSANLAKSDFVSNMSHELRTPLNGILGFSQLLQMQADTVLSDKHKEYVQHVLDAGNHLLNLINEILDLAKIEAGKIQLTLHPLDPVNAIQKSMEIFNPLASQHDVKISTDLPTSGSRIKIYSDQTRFKQILMNLCSNAIKYNHKGGTVEIKAETTSENNLRVSVSDTGPGISEKDLEKLFTPFNRLSAENSAVEGTGIGLSITRRLIELMSGTIGVESTIGIGSVFWFEFPLMVAKPDNNGKTSKLESYNGNVDFNGIPDCNVLYVEDNPDNSRLMSEIFRLSPHAKLTIVETGEDGVKAAQENDYDVYLLDLNLPGIDGFEVLGQIKALDKPTSAPFIAVTANIMPEILDKCREVGFVDILTKPINIANVIHTMQKTLETK